MGTILQPHRSQAVLGFSWYLLHYYIFSISLGDATELSGAAQREIKGLFNGDNVQLLFLPVVLISLLCLLIICGALCIV